LHDDSQSRNPTQHAETFSVKTSMQPCNRACKMTAAWKPRDKALLKCKGNKRGQKLHEPSLDSYSLSVAKGRRSGLYSGTAADPGPAPLYKVPRNFSKRPFKNLYFQSDCWPPMLQKKRYCQRTGDDSWNLKVLKASNSTGQKDLRPGRLALVQPTNVWTKLTASNARRACMFSVCFVAKIKKISISFKLGV
jgi:hypothetical protein